MAIDNLPEAHEQAMRAAIDTIVTMTDIKDFLELNKELREYLEGKFHPLVDSEHSGQMVGETSTIAMQLKVALQHMKNASECFQALALAMEEYGLPPKG
jgi:hypothetical protein